MSNAKKILTIAPHTERPDPPRIASVREKIRAQRHLAAMRSGAQLRNTDELDSLGILPSRDDWNSTLAINF